MAQEQTDLVIPYGTNNWHRLTHCLLPLVALQEKAIGERTLIDASTPCPQPCCPLEIYHALTMFALGQQWPFRVVAGRVLGMGTIFSH